MSECEKEEADEERESEEDLLVFDDSILGTSITVSNNGLRAARDEASFCNGVIFSKVEMSKFFLLGKVSEISPL